MVLCFYGPKWYRVTLLETLLIIIHSLFLKLNTFEKLFYKYNFEEISSLIICIYNDYYKTLLLCSFELDVLILHYLIWPFFFNLNDVSIYKIM